MSEGYFASSVLDLGLLPLRPLAEYSFTKFDVSVQNNKSQAPNYKGEKDAYELPAVFPLVWNLGFDHWSLFGTWDL